MENQTPVTNNKQDHYRLLIIIVILIFAGLLIFLILSRAKSQKTGFNSQETKVTITSTPALQVTGGVLSLVSTKQSYIMNENISVDVLANSQNFDIVGYDVLINYDSQALELIQAESLINEFQIFKINDPGKLTVTGTKNLVANTSNIWTDRKIIQLTFKPKKTGKFYINITNQIGKEKTQFVDSYSKVFIPQVGKIPVEIN